MTDNNNFGSEGLPSYPQRPPVPGAGAPQAPAGYGQQPPASPPPPAFGQSPAFGQPPAFGQQAQNQFVTHQMPMQFGSRNPQKKKREWLVPVAILGAGVLVAGGISLAFLLSRGGGDPVATEPTQTQSASPSASPEPTKTPKPTASPKPTATPTKNPAPTATSAPQPTVTIVPEPPARNAEVTDRSTIVVSAATVTTELEAMIEEYQSRSEDGSLWQVLPETDRNAYAFTAFQYLIVDLKGATLFGVTEESAQEYWALALQYESLLLSEQPLGESVTVDRDAFYFSYDGTTGDAEYKKK